MAEIQELHIVDVDAPDVATFIIRYGNTTEFEEPVSQEAADAYAQNYLERDALDREHDLGVIFRATHPHYQLTFPKATYETVIQQLDIHHKYQGTNHRIDSLDLQTQKEILEKYYPSLDRFLALSVARFYLAEKPVDLSLKNFQFCADVLSSAEKSKSSWIDILYSQLTAVMKEFTDEDTPEAQQRRELVLKELKGLQEFLRLGGRTYSFITAENFVRVVVGTIDTAIPLAHAEPFDHDGLKTKAFAYLADLNLAHREAYIFGRLVDHHSRADDLANFAEDVKYLSVDQIVSFTHNATEHCPDREPYLIAAMLKSGFLTEEQNLGLARWAVSLAAAPKLTEDDLWRLTRANAQEAEKFIRDHADAIKAADFLSKLGEREEIGIGLSHMQPGEVLDLIVEGFKTQYLLEILEKGLVDYDRGVELVQEHHVAQGNLIPLKAIRDLTIDPNGLAEYQALARMPKPERVLA